MASESGSSGDELAALLDAEFAEDNEPEEEKQGAETDGQIEANKLETDAKRRKIGERGGSCPPHPGFMGGICIRCGASKGEDDGEVEAGVALKYIHHGLEVSRSEAERLRNFSASHAMASRRLLLVLDLDHTLLNSTRISDISPENEAVLRQQLESQSGEERPLLYHLPYMRMWTKLRPGIHEFLAEANKFFELHVYTMGDNDYAAGMAQILDPDGRLFAGRVASARDAGPAGYKDVDVLLGAEDMVLIMDDTAGVWPRHRANLVQVDRYVYFPACADKFGLGVQSLLEKGEDEDASRGTLSACLRVLTDVHKRFFKEYDRLKESSEDGPTPDIRLHLSAVRRLVLDGVKILFSRIIPLDCADPSTHPAWKLATDLGALCYTSQSEDITHVVSNDITDKVRWGKQIGAHVVNINWLWCSAFMWEKADESRFPVASNASKQPQLPPSEEADLKAALAAAGGGQQ